MSNDSPELRTPDQQRQALQDVSSSIDLLSNAGTSADVLASIPVRYLQTLSNSHRLIRSHMTAQQQKKLEEARKNIEGHINTIANAETLTPDRRKELIAELNRLSAGLAPSMMQGEFKASIQETAKKAQNYLQENPEAVRKGMIAGGIALGAAAWVGLWVWFKEQPFWRTLLVGAPLAVGAFFGLPAATQAFQKYTKDQVAKQAAQKKAATDAQTKKTVGEQTAKVNPNAPPVRSELEQQGEKKAARVPTPVSSTPGEVKIAQQNKVAGAPPPAAQKIETQTKLTPPPAQQPTPNQAPQKAAEVDAQQLKVKAAINARQAAIQKSTSDIAGRIPAGRVELNNPLLTITDNLQAETGPNLLDLPGRIFTINGQQVQFERSAAGSRMMVNGQRFEFSLLGTPVTSLQIVTLEGGIPGFRINNPNNTYIPLPAFEYIVGTASSGAPGATVEVPNVGYYSPRASTEAPDVPPKEFSRPNIDGSASDIVARFRNVTLRRVP